MKNHNVEFETHYGKSSKLYRLFTKRFLKTINHLITPLLLDEHKILDIGCGEGFVLRYLEDHHPSMNLTAIDLDRRRVNITKRLSPDLKAIEGNVYHLPFSGSSFDIVLANEILEHLDHPERALVQIKRVSKKYIIISVPHEPLFSIGNLIRGAYWPRMGKTPEHVNFWSRKGIVNLLKMYFEVMDVRSCIPWTFVVCRNDFG